jgi:hypothetical protein
MASRTAYAVPTLVASLLTLPVGADAASMIVRARFSFDAVATCQQPAVQNYPVHAEGTAVLSDDKSAKLDMDSNIEGKTRYTAKLGAKTEAVAGSATVRVVNRHTLKAVRDYPNNSIVVYMTVIGNSCNMKIENVLKPGKRQYTFHGNLGVAYCNKPKVTHAECAPY